MPECITVLPYVMLWKKRWHREWYKLVPFLVTIATVSKSLCSLLPVFSMLCNQWIKHTNKWMIRMKSLCNKKQAHSYKFIEIFCVLFSIFHFPSTEMCFNALYNFRTEIICFTPVLSSFPNEKRKNGNIYEKRIWKNWKMVDDVLNVNCVRHREYFWNHWRYATRNEACYYLWNANHTKKQSLYTLFKY